MLSYSPLPVGACTFSEGLTYMPMLDAIVKSSGATIPSGTNRFTVVSKYVVTLVRLVRITPYKIILKFVIPKYLSFGNCINNW